MAEPRIAGFFLLKIVIHMAAGIFANEQTRTFSADQTFSRLVILSSTDLLPAFSWVARSSPTTSADMVTGTKRLFQLTSTSHFLVYPQDVRWLCKTGMNLKCLDRSLVPAVSGFHVAPLKHHGNALR